MFCEHCTICLVYSNEHDTCSFYFSGRISGTIIFCSNVYKSRDYCYFSYRCQGCITISDLPHHVSKIEFPYFILTVTLFNLIVLYIFIFIYFDLGKITFFIPKLKGKWYGQIWADFLPLPCFVIMGTEMGSGEGRMMGDFFLNHQPC